MVAGPIGEALVATGIGIAVAVPAVLAYNYFIRRKGVGHELEDLANGLVNHAIVGLYRGDAPAERSSPDSADRHLVQHSVSVPQEASA